MNKKGFTLIELLAVLVVIALILAIVFPTVNSIVKKGKDTVDNIQVNKILNGAYDYTIKYTDLLPNINEVSYITFNELKKYGYVDSDLINPNTNLVYPSDTVIKIEYVGKNYKGNLDNSLLYGYYLYSIYNNKGTCEPVINITGKLDLVTLNIGSNYTELNYSAVDCNNNDITDRVVKNITKDNKNENKIDSYKSGIYTIDYCVVDENGNSKCETISVVIKDTEVPILNIPDNITISTSITKMDLMDGVSCTDNSKTCEVDIEGDIEYGTPGKYIIKYISKDPAGNTITKKRVITVE